MSNSFNGGLSLIIIGLLMISFIPDKTHAQEKKAINRNVRSFVMPKGISRNSYTPGKLIVKYKDPKKSAAVKTLLSGLNGRCRGINSMAKIFRNPPDALTNVYQVNYVLTRAIEDVINEILQDDNIAYCEPSYIHHTYYSPNDPLTGVIDYFGQINAFSAWDVTKSSNNVTIGIIDSGFETTHEDLSASIAVNNQDPVNGIDDDHDGFVDNYWGWDFVGADYLSPREDNDPNSKNNAADHGIHVSGIAGAISDNNKGISSVGFNARLLLVKCAADNNGTKIYRGYEGIRYAVDHGAQVINCSWGNDVNSAFGKDIIDYAISKGCLVVAAGGNDHYGAPQYPAAYPGVLAVSNVDRNDIKSPTSSFGRHIGISAPGVNILSTTYKNVYDIKSGTSMAAPIVSSAAALIKSYFPHLSMQQVGEKLRSTADKIDLKNPQYAGMLGSGRLNVYRALKISLPSLKLQQIAFENEEPSSGGQTVSFYLTVKNFLRETSNLKIELSSTNPYVKMLNKELTISSIATLEEKRIGPFKMYLEPGIPFNSVVEFMVNYNNSGDYESKEYFSRTFNHDYINYKFNQITTTATSNGRIGYRNANADLGNGFVYNAENFLYECSLIMGISSNEISNNSRNNGTTADEDFVPVKTVRQILKTDSLFKTESEFNDSGNTKPLNVTVKQTHTVYKYSPDDKYVIVDYEVNNHNNFSLNNFYLGLFSDWDMDQSLNDIATYIRKERLGYTSAKNNPSVFAGVKLLNTAYPANYYPMANGMSGNPLEDEGLSKFEKFEIMSSGIKAQGIGEQTAKNTDVSFASSYGPVSIKPNSSNSFAFALLISQSRSDLEHLAGIAQAKYMIEIPEKSGNEEAKLNLIYPNPVLDKGYIEFSIPEGGPVLISLYSILGQRISILTDQHFEAGIHKVEVDSAKLPSGIYVYEMKYNKFKKGYKMIVIK